MSNNQILNLSECISRLGLGTVQFGQNYGIANQTGQISYPEVFNILSWAHQKGIQTLDTALSYGTSEEVIGEFIDKYKYNFHIISKLPSFRDKRGNDIDEYFLTSLRRLKMKSLYGYLIHQFEDYLAVDTLWNKLLDLKVQNRVQKIGFSLYKPEELERLLKDNVQFDIVQVPYSIFDRRFEPYFELLHSQGVEIHVRSVFLQGLAFVVQNEIPQYFHKAKKQFKQFKEFVEFSQIPPHAICIDFVLLNAYIDKVILGMDSLPHLKLNIQALEYLRDVKSAQDRYDFFIIDNEEILLPYFWKA